MICSRDDIKISEMIRWGITMNDMNDVVRPSLSTMTNDITGLNKTWCDESCCG